MSAQRKPQTLLASLSKSVPGAWEIARGQRWLARVAYGDSNLVILKGKCNLDDAADAIFVLDLESMAAKGQLSAITPYDATDTSPVVRPKHIAGHVPQVIVTMTPDGNLCAELPGFQATRRKVPLKAGHVEDSLRRILNDQLDGHYEIGAEGSPTQQQVRHWESHGTWPDSRCRFCIAEGRVKTSKRRLRREIISKSKDVEVRRIASKTKAKHGNTAVTVTSRSIEDLGL